MDKLTPNELTFIALANEYCHTVEHMSELAGDDQMHVVAQMLKLLPRLYITASDMEGDSMMMDDAYITPSLEEDVYDIVRQHIAAVMGDEDLYLEVFIEDMKYSDTPIAASVSEGLADLYQEFYNLLHSIEDMPTSTQRDLLALCKGNFAEYWGQTLTNVLRALHSIYYSLPA